MKPSGWIELLIAAVIAILAALYPLVASNLMLGHGVDAMMYIALATSWVLFSGPTHYISLATAAFFGVGGFLVGTGMSDYQTSFWSMLALSCSSTNLRFNQYFIVSPRALMLRVSSVVVCKKVAGLP